MKLKFFLVLMTAVLCLAFAACSNKQSDPVESGVKDDEITVAPVEGTEPQDTEPPHVHEFVLNDTVKGTCVAEGYEVYGCSCGISYKNLIPSEHKYSEQKDTTGKYTKKLCELCGEYKIVRNQTYIHNLTFEGASGDIVDYTNKQKNLKFYGAAAADGTKGKIEIKNSIDGSHMYIYDCNYYIQDTSETMLKNKFIVSADIKFEKYADLELISFAHQKAGGKWNYNSGVIKITSDGKVRFFGDDTVSNVVLKSKGYNNFTVVCDPITSLCDVYINEKLVKSGIDYVDIPNDVVGVYIRYFDRKAGFAASADNLKLYVAGTPEFIVPDGLVFKK